jgi:uncharacterized YccA/Bax inhibitor family protein
MPCQSLESNDVLKHIMFGLFLGSICVMFDSFVLSKVFALGVIINLAILRSLGILV